MKQVLLIDDDKNLLATISRLARSRSWNIETVSDPREALRKLGKSRYCVIISDYMMPGVDGVSLLEYARAKQNTAVRMLFSGHADVTDIADAVNVAGVFRVIFKPCLAVDLLEHIEEAIMQYRALEQNRRSSNAPKQHVAASSADGQTINFEIGEYLGYEKEDHRL